MPFPKSDGCILYKFKISGGKKKKTKENFWEIKLLMTSKDVPFGKAQSIILSSVSVLHPGRKEH